MPLLTALRQHVQGKAIQQYERCVRYIAARAREDAQTFKWIGRVSTGAEGRIITFVTQVEGYAALAAREDPDAMIRRLYGEGDGNALLEAMGEAVTSESYQVFQPREDLTDRVLQTGAPPPIVVTTRLRVTPGGGLGCEHFIQLVAEAAAKVDEERRYLVLQPTIGELDAYIVVQSVIDPGQLDRQVRVPELLAEAYGGKEAEKIFREGTACIREARSELSILREDLSNLQ